MTTTLPNQTTDIEATTITVRPIAGNIGAEIDDVDLSRPLADDAVADIRAALLRHRVVFFRDQHIDHAQHIEFARRFGELTYAHPFDDQPPDEHPEIYTVDLHRQYEQFKLSPEERKEALRLTHRQFGGWHSDVTAAINPPFASILRAEVVPSIGGDTTWTNLVAAYEGLSDPLRRFVDGLYAEHRYGVGYGASTAALQQRIADNPLVSHHPVVRVHPETGERALLVNPGFTSHIVGLSSNESRRVLDLLFEQLSRSEYTVRFRWEPGSVAFWDNRTSSHEAPRDLGDDEPRTLHRVTLIGDVPVGPDGRESKLIEGKPFGGDWKVSAN
jgi:alpha-ketoglutarate-dependent taurine dioxygenase